MSVRVSIFPVLFISDRRREGSKRAVLLHITWECSWVEDSNLYSVLREGKTVCWDSALSKCYGFCSRRQKNRRQKNGTQSQSTGKHKPGESKFFLLSGSYRIVYLFLTSVDLCSSYPSAPLECSHCTTISFLHKAIISLAGLYHSPLRLCLDLQIWRGSKYGVCIWVHTFTFWQFTWQLKGLMKILFQQFFHMFAKKSALKHLQRVCNDGIKASALPFVKQSSGTVVLSVSVRIM